ncbi:MAG: hypothetical protein IPK71_02430 [Myxococcales bacterium]|nr:hypothetical protein [Myxococcales bacterium]
MADPTGRIEQLSGVKSDSSAGMAGAAGAIAVEMVMENPQAVVNTGRSLLGAASRIVRREGQAIAGRGVQYYARAAGRPLVRAIDRVSSGAKGRRGEAAVRSVADIGGKVPFKISGRWRIPDGTTRSTLAEVKNVKYLSYTQQLQDYAAHAKLTGREFHLWVRPGATLSEPLEAAIERKEVVLKRIPFGRR